MVKVIRLTEKPLAELIMSDFINDIQADELVNGNYYMGEYQPTDQDLADMAEAFQLSDDETDDMLADMHDSAGHWADEYAEAHEANLDWDWMAEMADDDAITDVGHGKDWGDTGEYDCNDW
jgi:hypothetical protein